MVAAREDLKTVLFICVHNAARSQMAEAFFNEMAKDGARALSAGSQPADRVNMKAVKVMVEIGIDISREVPKMLTAEMVEESNLIITMGCGEEVCPVVPKEILDWDIEDPSEMNIKGVREIRDQIKTKVERLIESIGLS